MADTNFDSSPSYWNYALVYLQFSIAILFCLLEELLYYVGILLDQRPRERQRVGYVPIFDRFHHYFIHNVVRTGIDMYNNPIASMAGPTTILLQRVSNNRNVTLRFTGKKLPVMNLASYNYLGMNQNSGPVADSVENTIRSYGVGICTTQTEFGTTPLHRQLEAKVAEFLQTEDAIVFGMGFATNSANIPALFDNETLVISDERSHASTALGCKLIQGTVIKFKHNDMKSLENCLRQGMLAKSSANKCVKWRKVVILVEGIYSMEGTIVNLPEVLRLKTKYKAYVYLDEAHSIGALGKSGRGVTDYFGIHSGEIDVLMGTFTKSFASAGGYIAGKKTLIDYLRIYSHANSYATSLSPPIVEQTLQSLKIFNGDIDGDNSRALFSKLQENTLYFRRKLTEMGFQTLGSPDSPAVPVLIPLPAKLRYFVLQLQKNGVATAAAGPPAVPLTSIRARFCLSSAHSKEMLVEALEAIEKVGRKAKII